MTNATLELEHTLDELRRFLPNLVEASGYIAELFYVQVTDDTWQEFSQLLKAMDDLYKFSSDIHSELENKGGDLYLRTALERFISQMKEKFEVLNGYMDEEAYIHAADYIRFELSPLFLSLSNLLGDDISVVQQRLAANMLYLKNYYPDTYEVIKDIEWDCERYQAVKAINGQCNICAYANNRKMNYFYSNYDQEHEVERWVGSIGANLNDKSNVIVYGFGLGYHLTQLNQQYPHLQLVVMEPDEQLLLTAMRAVDFKELFARLNIKEFFVGDNKVRRENVLYRFFTLSKGATEVISIPFYDRVFSEQKMLFVEEAKTAILDYVSSVNTYQVFGLQWIQNRLFNFPLIVNTPSIEGLKGTMDGITAVIVGAGPSLEADIEYVREIKNHALIIAAGSAIQSLKHFGIDPHLIVSVDGGDFNYNVFKNLNIQDTPFLYGPQIHYKILENNNNLFHTFLNNDLTTRYLAGLEPQDPVFGSNHSVTGTAIQAAIYMGCKQIVFTGQDLSFPAGKKYAPGAKHIPNENNEAEIKRATLLVDNVQGTKNQTTDSMFITLRDIEDLLALHGDIHFINTSQQGALIAHTEWALMKNVLARLEQVKVPADYMTDLMKGHLKPYQPTRKKEMADRLLGLTGQMNDVDSKLKRMERALGSLKALARTKPVKCLDSMVDIEDAWEAVLASVPFMTLLTTTNMNDIRLFDRDRPDIAAESNVIKKSELFCQILTPIVNNMRWSLKDLGILVQEAIRRMESDSNSISEIMS